MRATAWLPSLLALATFAAPPVGAPLPDAPTSHLHETIERARRDWDVPGLAVAIVKDDEIVLARGYGVRELGRPEAVDENTVFAIASNTKAFTATAVGLLVHEGRLGWHDRVIDHLPGFRLHDAYATRELRVRDLLCHRSGLGTWAGDLVWFGSTYRRDEVLARLRHIEPDSSFRSEFGYSNTMFLAAGQLVRALTGESWDALVERRLFDPLGMKRTTTSTEALADLQNVATPHTAADGSKVAIRYWNVDNCGPAGSINSSALDMSRWIRMQLAGGTLGDQEIVPPEVLEETRTPHLALRVPLELRAMMPSVHFRAYGLGWGLQDYAGRLIVGHSGGLPGMLSRVVLVPEERLGLVILTNDDQHGLTTPLAFDLLDALLGLEPRDWSARDLERWREGRRAAEQARAELETSRNRDTAPSLPLDRYAGTYDNALYGRAEITVENGGLRLELAAHTTVEAKLAHWHHDTFECLWNDPVFGTSLVPFTLDASGNVAGFVLSVRPEWIDPLEYEFKRVASE